MHQSYERWAAPLTCHKCGEKYRRNELRNFHGYEFCPRCFEYVSRNLFGFHPAELNANQEYFGSFALTSVNAYGDKHRQMVDVYCLKDERKTGIQRLYIQASSRRSDTIQTLVLPEDQLRAGIIAADKPTQLRISASKMVHGHA